MTPNQQTADCSNGFTEEWKDPLMKYEGRKLQRKGSNDISSPDKDNDHIWKELVAPSPKRTIEALKVDSLGDYLSISFILCLVFYDAKRRQRTVERAGGKSLHNFPPGNYQPSSQSNPLTQQC